MEPASTTSVVAPDDRPSEAEASTLTSSGPATGTEIQRPADDRVASNMDVDMEAPVSGEPALENPLAAQPAVKPSEAVEVDEEAVEEESESDGDTYEVHAIINSRTTSDGTVEYLIKWRGWGPQHNTWEPACNIMDEELIATFEAKQASKRKRASPKKASPKKRSAPSAAGGEHTPDRSAASASGAAKPVKGAAGDATSASDGVAAEGGGGGGGDGDGADGGVEGAAADDGADLRDQGLLAEMRLEWLEKYRQKDLAKAAGVAHSTLSHWLHNKVSSATTRRNFEAKMSRFLNEYRAAMGEAGGGGGGGGGSGGGGASSMLPPPREKPPPKKRRSSSGGADGDGDGAAAGGKRGGKGGGGRKKKAAAGDEAAEEGNGAAAAQKGRRRTTGTGNEAEAEEAEVAEGGEAKAKAAEEDGPVELVDDEDEQSEGEGEQRIEDLLTLRKFAVTSNGTTLFQPWLLVKWYGVDHSENTWEQPKNLHEEAVEEFEWKRKLPVALSEVLELPPHVSGDALEAEHLLPVPAIRPPEEDEDDEDEEEEEEEAAAAASAAAAGEAAQPEEEPKKAEEGDTTATKDGDEPAAKAEEAATEEGSRILEANDAAAREAAAALLGPASPSKGAAPTPPHDDDETNGGRGSATPDEAEVAAVEAAWAAKGIGLGPTITAPAATAPSSAPAKGGRSSASGGGRGGNQRMRRRFQPPPPFVPDGAEALRAELARGGLEALGAAAELQACGAAARAAFGLPLSTPLAVGTAVEASVSTAGGDAPPHGGDDGRRAPSRVYTALAAIRQDRRVRIAFACRPPPRGRQAAPASRPRHRRSPRRRRRKEAATVVVDAAARRGRSRRCDAPEEGPLPVGFRLGGRV